MFVITKNPSQFTGGMRALHHRTLFFTSSYQKYICYRRDKSEQQTPSPFPKNNHRVHILVAIAKRRLEIGSRSFSAREISANERQSTMVYLYSTGATMEEIVDNDRVSVVQRIPAKRGRIFGITLKRDCAVGSINEVRLRSLSFFRPLRWENLYIATQCGCNYI